jgi:hypothetical protein
VIYRTASDEKSVEGIRHPARTPLGIAFGILGVLCLLSPLWWIVELIRHASYRFNDGFIGSLGWSIVFFFVFMFGVLVADAGLSKKNRLESDCPRCGAYATRRFWDFMPTECGTCIAYLRADGDRVREESLDQAESYGHYYAVPAKRYLPAAKRDQQEHFEFKIPQLCAQCGSSDVRHESKIVDRTPSNSESGLFWKAVAFSSSSQQRRKMGLRQDGRFWNRTPVTPNDNDRLDEGLSLMRVPVCNEHKDATPVSYNSGKLEFALYRYYKEFLALNDIDAPETKS